MLYALLTLCHTLRSQGIITLCNTLLLHGELTLCCTLLSYDVLTLCRTLLSRAILTLCLTLLSHAVLTLCHVLLSHVVLSLCRSRLIELCGINNFVILFAHKKKYTNVLGSHLTKETRNKLTTLSLASGDDPYKMYVLEEEWMLATITTLLSHSSNCSLTEQ